MIKHPHRMVMFLDNNNKITATNIFFNTRKRKER
jgi:hypothetical protein